MNKLRTLLIGLTLSSICLAGNTCKGVDIKEDGFGDTQKVKEMKIGDHIIANDPYGTLLIESINDTHYINIEVFVRGAINTGFVANTPIYLATDKKEKLTLNTVELTSPQITGNSPYRTTWNFKAQINDDHLSKMLNDGVSMIRVPVIEGHKDLTLSKKQKKTLASVLNCISCSDCK